MSLSPWDLSGQISFNFDLYRPRRASYVFATRAGRQRNESYRHALKGESHVEGIPDFIEGIQRQKRKDSYKAATQSEEYQLRPIKDSHHDRLSSQSNRRAISPFLIASQHKKQHKRNLSNHFEALADIPELKESKSCRSLDRGLSTESKDEVDYTKSERMRRHSSPCKSLRRQSSVQAAFSGTDFQCRKNLLILSVSFLLIFTAFRAIQNLQSSLNTKGHLGVIAMGCVHATMFLTCLFTPVLINKLASKWTIVLGLLFYLFWIAANFYPTFYTLIPTSIGVGFGQSLAWGAQVTYIQKLAVDYARISKEITQQELFKLNGIFLALFQTSHIWGNLVSSLILNSQYFQKLQEFPIDDIAASNMTDEIIVGGDAQVDDDIPAGEPLPFCGMLDTCMDSGIDLWAYDEEGNLSPAANLVQKLMGAYLAFAFTGFVLIVLFLEKIGAKAQTDKPCLQVVWTNVQMLVSHKIYRLLTPLLIFNGFEQGFIYSDWTKSYITCTVGVEYVGYNMITLGVVNSVFSVIVGVASKHLPREAVIGIGAILHIGLMVFLLVWIPDKNLFIVFFVISALWGICDAVWQTQCNYLVNMSCNEASEHDIAFQNFRMLQGLGAALAFFMGSFLCVSVKLYILLSLLVLAILCYVVVEIQLKNAELEQAQEKEDQARAMMNKDGNSENGKFQEGLVRSSDPANNCIHKSMENIDTEKCVLTLSRSMNKL